MNVVSLDQASKAVQQFFRSLPLERDGCILEMNGKPLLRVVPITEVSGDRSKLKAAILARRDESRKSNADWQAVDREMWQGLAKSTEDPQW
jgi:hypothetical protein